MTARAQMRGHPVHYDGERWRYDDTGEPAPDRRPCKLCGEPPTPEGYDACEGPAGAVVRAAREVVAARPAGPRVRGWTLREMRGMADRLERLSEALRVHDGKQEQSG